MEKVNEYYSKNYKMSKNFDENVFVVKLFLCAMIFVEFNNAKDVKKFQDLTKEVKSALVHLIQKNLDELAKYMPHSR